MGTNNKKSDKRPDIRELSEEEKEIFEKWLNEGNHRILFEKWEQSSSVRRDLILLKLLKARKRSHLNRFVRAINHRQRLRRMAVAASILFIIGACLYYIASGSGAISETHKEMAVLIPEVDHPVILKTASRIDCLVNYHPISRLEQQGIYIYSSDTKISYSKEESTQPIINDSLFYNELIVPRGKIYEVELVDGTGIRLNSESRLRYPILFKESGPREVFLQGEGYFRVKAAPERPFIVHSPRVETLAYGTEFNIKAYPGDSYSNVTLVEGKLKVKDVLGAEMLLLPNQEINCGSNIFADVPQPANVEDIISWSEGKLYFNERQLWDIAKDLERKYDITIIFDSPTIKELVFYSKTQKYNQIESILELLKLTGEVDYQIKGRTVYLNESNEK